MLGHLIQGLLLLLTNWPWQDTDAASHCSTGSGRWPTWPASTAPCPPRPRTARTRSPSSRTWAGRQQAPDGIRFIKTLFVWDLEIDIYLSNELDVGETSEEFLDCIVAYAVWPAEVRERFVLDSNWIVQLSENCFEDSNSNKLPSRYLNCSDSSDLTVLTYCFLSLGLMLTKLWVSHTASTCTMDTVVVKNEDGNRWMICHLTLTPSICSVTWRKSHWNILNRPSSDWNQLSYK